MFPSLHSYSPGGTGTPEISNASLTPSPRTFQAVIRLELSSNSQRLSMCSSDVSMNPLKSQKRLNVTCGRSSKDFRKFSGRQV